MSTYFSRLLQTVEGDRPFDGKQVMADAKNVELLSRLPWEGFVPGSERGETKAKEDIWFEEERFKKLSSDLEGKTSNLSKATESGDLKKIKLAFEQTRDTCNACHKEFRKK
jgi:cytochrome c556